MAVPKKKRSKAIIKLRRFVETYKILRKKQLKIRTFSNFLNISSKPEITCDFNNIMCAYYIGSFSKKICVDCYKLHFCKTYKKQLN